MNYTAFRIVATFSILIVATTTDLLAAPVTVVNPGFEDISGENVVNEFTFGELNGWDLYDPNNVTDNGDGPTFYIGTLTPFQDPNEPPGVFVNFPGGAAEGQRLGIAFNFDGSEGIGEYGFFQELSATLQPHTTYTLDVEIGNIDSGRAMSGQFFPLEGFPGYRVELVAGGLTGMMLEEDDNLLAGSIPDGEWATSTITYTTGASHTHFGENLGILLVNLNQEDPNFPNSDVEVDFDDVRLDASPALDGDFDFDGNVDGIDVLIWQRDYPALYDSGDLLLWRTNFGSTTFALSAIPEPTSAAILLSGMAAIMIGLGSRPLRYQ